MNSNAPADEAPNDASYSYGRLDDDGYGHTPKQSRQGSSRNPGSSLPRWVQFYFDLASFAASSESVDIIIDFILHFRLFVPLLILTVP